MTPEQKVIRTIYLSVAGNTSLAAIKWLTGYFGNSYALIADAIESTSDVFSSLLVWFGLKFSNLPADKNHPYGHGRAEPLITFLIVGFLIASAVIIAYQSICNIFTPHDLPKAYTLIVLGIIIIVKEIFYRIISAQSKKTKSLLLNADAWHHRSDAVTSLTAFAGISIAIIFGKGYEAADDWAALIASVIIFYTSYKIFRPALGEIMDEQLSDDLISEIRQISKKTEGIIDTEKCFVRKTGIKYYIDLHTTVDANITVQQGHYIAHKLKDKIKIDLPQVADILIHIEPNK